jgi:hypothetical protein
MTEKEIVEKIQDLQRRVLALENSGDNIIQKKKTKALSPKEYLIDKLAGEKKDDNNIKLLLLSSYLEGEWGLKSYNATDLEEIFREAKVKPPKNINDVANKLVEKAYLMEAKEKRIIRRPGY